MQFYVLILSILSFHVFSLFLNHCAGCTVHSRRTFLCNRKNLLYVQQKAFGVNTRNKSNEFLSLSERVREVDREWLPAFYGQHRMGRIGCFEAPHICGMGRIIKINEKGHFVLVVRQFNTGKCVCNCNFCAVLPAAAVASDSNNCGATRVTPTTLPWTHTPFPGRLLAATQCTYVWYIVNSFCLELRWVLGWGKSLGWYHFVAVAVAVVCLAKVFM